jgi:polyphosphate glucokinase
MQTLGIDVGGSGIKGAIVDTDAGKLVSERIRIPTPQPATPELIAETVSDLMRMHNWQGRVGIGFPAAVREGIVLTATNIDKSWLGIQAHDLFARTGAENITVLNDADAAGMAEMRFGAGQNNSGLVILITVGTGIGTVIFYRGMLLPNTELGHIYLANGFEAEEYASDATRKNEDLKWKKWAKRFNLYLDTMQALFWPDLFILGGGISKKFDKYADALLLETPIVPATLLNEAGIIGAAVAAAEAGT